MAVVCNLLPDGIGFQLHIPRSYQHRDHKLVYSQTGICNELNQYRVERWRNHFGAIGQFPDHPLGIGNRAADSWLNLWHRSYHLHLFHQTASFRFQPISRWNFQAQVRIYHGDPCQSSFLCANRKAGVWCRGTSHCA